jgi:hypothetical protein
MEARVSHGSTHWPTSTGRSLIDYIFIMFWMITMSLEKFYL